MKFCPVLMGSWQCYKFFINYILQLHVKSFILARWGRSFVLPGSCFARMKFSFVITSACLSRLKKLITKSIEVDHSSFYCIFRTCMMSICKKKVNSKIKIKVKVKFFHKKRQNIKTELMKTERRH